MCSSDLATVFIRKVIRRLNARLEAEGESLLRTGVDESPSPKERRWLTWPDRRGNWGALSPGSLLDPLNRVVRFHGRSKEVELPLLTGWCQADMPWSFKAYAAFGGVGKTRLAVELCRTLAQKHGWEAGFLDPKNSEPITLGEEGDGKGAKPLLIVVDYAGDVRKVPLLRTLIVQLPTCRRPKVRLLMLERDTLWLGRLRGNRAVDAVLEAGQSHDSDLNLALQPVVSTSAERINSYRIAATAFKTAIYGGSRKPGLRDGPSDPKSSIYKQILFLHAQALERVSGGTDGRRRVTILRQLLDREREYWRRMMPTRGIPDYLRNGIEAAVVALGKANGTGSVQDAVTLLRKVSPLRDQPRAMVEQVALLLREVYPDAGVGIAPLQPDPLHQCLADEWLKISPLGKA